MPCQINLVHSVSNYCFSGHTLSDKLPGCAMAAPTNYDYHHDKSNQRHSGGLAMYELLPGLDQLAEHVERESIARMQVVP